MRKFMLAAGLATLLTGCGDDGVYEGTEKWKTTQ